MKGHAKHIDAVSGRTTAQDKEGNDGADKLAVDGASIYKLPSDVVKRAHRCRDLAVHTQQLMVLILKARFLAEASASKDAEDDWGSDMDDCVFDDEGVDSRYNILSDAD